MKHILRQIWFSQGFLSLANTGQVFCFLWLNYQWVYNYLHEKNNIGSILLKMHMCMTIVTVKTAHDLLNYFIQTDYVYLRLFNKRFTSRM